jgi:hypothetical protein
LYIVWCAHCSVHKASLKKFNPHNVERRHKQHFAGWFEERVSHHNFDICSHCIARSEKYLLFLLELQTKQEYDQGKATEDMLNLARGPDEIARVFNRCFINATLFRTVSAETSLITQNSGVLVKGDESTGNMDWYGVIKKIMSVQFTGRKEVIMFQCDWFDVPAPTKNKGKGFNKDQYGIIDIDTTRLRYSDDPYILATQAEQVFYVKHTKKLNWCSVVRIKPRNIFLMPESTVAEDEAENNPLDVDSLVVGVEDMAVIDQADVMNWRRTDMEGEAIDSSVIQKAIANSSPEPDDEYFTDEGEDDVEAYIDDGVVAPAVATSDEPDDDFFV